MDYNVSGLTADMVQEVGKIIVGKSAQIRLMIMAILAEGHILLEDLPGVGKTTLIKTLSTVLGCDFKRIQFTPDLLPSDIVGMNIYNQKNCEFELMRGPVMTNILLADEINRAIPRTQAALLESMEEKQVTIDGVTYPLKAPFIVMATQNPVESESTFRLPAAQMDRFLIQLSLGYPNKEEEIRMLRILGDDIPFDQVKTVTNAAQIAQIQKQVQSVYVADSILTYILDLVSATRGQSSVKMGASPRASRAIYKAAKAFAAISGRDFVVPDDIQQIACPILCHRILLSNEAKFAGSTAESVMNGLISAIPVPPGRRELFNAR